jgi:hypothetical protein
MDRFEAKCIDPEDDPRNVVRERLVAQSDRVGRRDRVAGVECGAR